MSAKLFNRQGTGRSFGQSFIEHFGESTIEVDIILRRVNGIPVYDICQICHEPVLSTQETVCKGFLTDEHLIHKTCVEISLDKEDKEK